MHLFLSVQWWSNPDLDLNLILVTFAKSSVFVGSFTIYEVCKQMVLHVVDSIIDIGRWAHFNVKLHFYSKDPLSVCLVDNPLL